jgi:APA family basic amino acid/polyamine antiporter
MPFRDALGKLKTFLRDYATIYAPLQCLNKRYRILLLEYENMSNEARPSAFARRASGLVKEVSLPDYVLWLMYAALIFFFNLLVFPVYIIELPGANITFALLIGCVIGIPFFITYGALGSIMPRSGGDYIYQSRGIHPAVGLAITLALGLLLATSETFSALALLSVTTDALGPYFLIVGTESKIASIAGVGKFLGTLNGIMTVGIILLVLGFILYLGGMRWVARIQRYVMLPAIIISGISIPLMFLFGSTIYHFNYISQAITGNPDTYGVILNGTAGLGFMPAPYSLSQTLILGLISGTTAIGGVVFANPLLGEVKKAGNFRNLTLAYTIAGFIVGLLFLIPELGLLVNNYGSTFVQAASFASLVGVKGTPPGIPLTYGFLALASTNNIILQTFSIFGFIAVAFMFPVVILMAAARYFIAQSIDGLLPLWFSSINRIVKKPVNAFVPPVILTAIVLYLVGASPMWLLLFVGLGTIYTFVLEGASALSAVTMPFKQKFIVKASPVGKYPWVMQVAGILVIALAVIEGYEYYTVPSLALSIGVLGYAWMVSATIAGLIIYVAMKSYKKRQGVDVSLAFTEIPPD